MKEYEEQAGEMFEEICYTGEAIKSGFLNDLGERIKDNRKWKEVKPDPKCKICGGRGYQTYGNDCICIWKEIK